MDGESFAPQAQRHNWETPGFAEVGVSAEATAYVGIWEDWPWD